MPLTPSWHLTPFLWLNLGLHLAAAVAAVVKPSLWPWLLPGVVLAHGTILLAAVSPRCSLLGPNLMRLPADQAAGVVALTFDDGPDPEVTLEVLEMLDRHGARASFFLIGERAERYPQVAAEIVRRGHRVENHTQHHSYAFAFLGRRRLGAEIDDAQHSLRRLCGRAPEYLRAPAGVRSPLLESVLARRGLRLASWTRRAFDTVEKDPRRVVRRLLRGLREGDVLLLHDGSAARDATGRAVVLSALPKILDELARRGWQAVALPSR